MDLTATCLDAGGAAATPDYPLDGISLLPHIAGDALPPERLLFWRMFDRNQASVRSGKWKYLRVSGKEYLFDLDYDERERTDFAKKQPALVAELRARWAEWEAGMLPLPKELPAPIAQLSEMLW
jgi:arylsulfatase A-like enzyme